MALAILIAAVLGVEVLNWQFRRRGSSEIVLVQPLLVSIILCQYGGLTLPWQIILVLCVFAFDFARKMPNGKSIVAIRRTRQESINGAKPCPPRD